MAGGRLTTYLVPVLVVAVWQGQPWQDPLHWAAVIGGARPGRVLGGQPGPRPPVHRRWPAWTRPLPRAVLGAQLVLLVAGAAVLVTGLVRHLDRVTALARGPGSRGRRGHRAADGPAGVGPECVVWAASYALGSGFAVGAGSVVAPAATELGILPVFRCSARCPPPVRAARAAVVAGGRGPCRRRRRPGVVRSRPPADST